MKASNHSIDSGSQSTVSCVLNACQIFVVSRGSIALNGVSFSNSTDVSSDVNCSSGADVSSGSGMLVSLSLSMRSGGSNVCSYPS